VVLVWSLLMLTLGHRWLETEGWQLQVERRALYWLGGGVTGYEVACCRSAVMMMKPSLCQL
jgi:hypothetical protein